MPIHCPQLPTPCSGLNGRTSWQRASMGTSMHVPRKGRLCAFHCLPARLRPSRLPSSSRPILLIIVTVVAWSSWSSCRCCRCCFCALPFAPPAPLGPSALTDLLTARPLDSTTAIIAGVQGVKKTSELIPFCHPLPVPTPHTPRCHRINTRCASTRND